jgi:TetR/AcrR family tetracycline transcriptional repressor
MPRPKGQSTLSRERILDAALRLVDREGVEGLSMRKLAAELGVDPMSIYHHIDSKDALLRTLVERVFASMPAPPQRGHWKRRVREWADAYHSVAAAHPNLVLRIVSDPATVAIAAVHVNESLYAAIEASGLPPKAIVSAADVIVDYVNGYTLAFAPPVSPGADATERYKAELETRPAEQTATQRRLFAESDLLEHREGFGFGLDVVLSGLDQLRRPG